MPQEFWDFLQQLPTPIKIGGAFIFFLGLFISNISRFLKESTSLGEYFQNNIPLLRISRFSSRETGIVISAIRGDVKAKVQKHISKWIRSRIERKPYTHKVRVLRVNQIIDNPTEARLFAEEYRASIILGGANVENHLFYSIYVPQIKQATHGFLPDHQSVDALIQIIRNILNTLPPPTGDLQGRINHLEARVESIWAHVRERDKVSTGAIIKYHNNRPSSSKVEQETRRQRYGLVVGVSSYDRLPDLLYSASDAEALKKQIEKIWGKNAHIKSLTDTTATLENINNELATLCNVARIDDQVWLYFSGHVYVSGDNSGNLLPTDVKINSTKELEDSSISTKRIEAWVKQLRCKQIIIIIDACLSAMFITDLETLKARGINCVVITAGDSTGYVRSINTLKARGGVFTQSIVDGLAGNATRDSSEIITHCDLFDYVTQEVLRYSHEPNKWAETKTRIIVSIPKVNDSNKLLHR